MRSRNTTTAFYRWLAVFGIVALTGVVLAYRSSNQHATLTATSGGRVPLLGSSVQNTPDLRADTAAFGRMPIVRVYYTGLPSPDAWSGLAGENHSAVIVSFKALPRTILSGADDAALRHFFDSAPTGHPIYYSYYHEPEDNIAAGQFRLSDYKAAWARVVSIANSAHNPYLHSTLILMSWDLVPASHRNWKDYLPGGRIISTLGWDAYPTGSATNENPQLQPPSGFMAPAIAASKSVGLPYGFPEFGLSTSKGRPAWLQTVGTYIMHSGALFASYFNGNDQYPTLRLTDAASIAVWRSFVTASRNGDAGGGPTPTPTPSPSPSGPAPTGVRVANLTLRPSSVSLSTEKTAALKFSLSQRANVTVCVLTSSGKVIRTVSRPASTAGEVDVSYLRYRLLSHRLAPGSYRVLVVASNASGSSARSAGLRITS